MITEIFSVYDMAAARYLDPFVAPTIEVAIRGFGQACKKEGHQFFEFPEDYALYHVGSFNGELGVLTPMEARKVSNAGSFQSSELEAVG